MKKLHFVLVRLLQFIVFTVFVFTVLAYFGAFLLLPLDLVSILVRLFGLVGIHGFIGAMIAIPSVGYLCLIVYKIPGLCQMVLDTGLDLVKTGKAKVDAFNEIAEAVKS